jgi:hypothetical protein
MTIPLRMLIEARFGRAFGSPGMLRSRFSQASSPSGQGGGGMTGRFGLVLSQISYVVLAQSAQSLGD